MGYKIEIDNFSILIFAIAAVFLLIIFNRFDNLLFGIRKFYATNFYATEITFFILLIIIGVWLYKKEQKKK